MTGTNAMTSLSDEDDLRAWPAPLPRAKVMAFDLKKTLIHECGHLIVGDRLGAELPFADVWINEDPGPDDKLINGHVRRYSEFPDHRATQLIGVAGLVAESLAGEDEFYSLDFLDELEAFPDQMSASDRKLAGEMDEALVDECADILMRDWSDLIVEALHFLSIFEKRYTDDADAVEAAASVRVELQGLQDRFRADKG